MNKLKSRKFWVAIVTGGVMIANAAFDLDWSVDKVLAIILPAVAYIFGEAWVDSKKTAVDSYGQPRVPDEVLADPAFGHTVLEAAAIELARIAEIRKVSEKDYQEALTKWRVKYPTVYTSSEN